MKIEIVSDVFDIVKRIKKIDKDYYIIFDTLKCVYELHHRKQYESYCFSYDNNCLDNRLLDMVFYTNVNNIDNICNEIDKNNNNIEQERLNKIKDDSEYMVREIYNFEANTSKGYNDSAFSTVWS